MDVRKGYIRDVGVPARPISVQDRSHDQVFRVRTMSAASNRSNSYFRQYSDVNSANHHDVPADNVQNRKRVPSFIDMNKLVLFELRFYYGKDSRFNFQHGYPVHPVRPKSSSNKFYAHTNDTASRQMFRTSRSCVNVMEITILSIQVRADNFATFAKTLALADKKNPLRSTLAASSAIMKRLADEPKDMSEILNKFERFTLNLTDVCLQQLGVGRRRFFSVSDLTPRQNLALNTVDKTLKTNRVNEIQKMTWMLKAKIQKHEKFLDKLIQSQETFSKATGDLYDNNESTSVLHRKMNVPIPASPLVGLLQRLQGLRSKRQILNRSRVKSHTDMYTGLDRENYIRQQMRQIADDIYGFTKRAISKKFESGIRYLRKVIQNVVPLHRREFFEEILSSIIPDDEADNLIASASELYHYPQVKSFMRRRPGEDLIPNSSYSIPETYFSACFIDQRPVKDLRRRLPWNARSGFLPLKYFGLHRPNINKKKVINEGIKVHVTSVVPSPVSFGWISVKKGTSGVEKRWGFFYPA